jgi:hypothetical protein
VNRHKQSVRRAPVIEPLENRQLMHAVIDLRLAGSTDKEVTVTSVGQQIDLEIWVTITGDNADTSDDTLQSINTSLLSTNISGGAAQGTLTAANVAPFNGNFANTGSTVDLDADGDLDIGRNDNSNDVGFFLARSNSQVTDGTVEGNGKSFKVGTAQFTVTALNEGIQTNLVARPRGGGAIGAIVFVEDGQVKNGSANLFSAGPGIVLRRPGTATVSGRVFDDKNATGLFDGDDTGISGFRVFLDEDFDGVLDADEPNKPVSATGTYTFTNVVAGTYRVREVFKDGWRQSSPGSGYHEVALGYGQAAKSLSFANTTGVLIKGSVFHDSDQDKVFDAGEDPLANWRVIVDMNKNGIWDTGDISKLTNSKGQYRLSLLTNGTFTLMIKLETGYKQTTNGGFPREITLGPGGTTSNKNFGVKRLKTT